MGLIRGIKNLAEKAKTRDGYKFKSLEDTLRYETLITFDVDISNESDRAVGFFKKSSLKALSRYFLDAKFIEVLQEKLRTVAHEYVDLLRETGVNKQDMEERLSKHLTSSVNAIEEMIKAEKEKINNKESKKNIREKAIKEYNESGKQIIDKILGNQTDEPEAPQRGE